jgi:hypothetical protein
MSIDVESHGGIQVKIGDLLTSQGKSAYEIAVSNGFAGTEAEWLASLEGLDGLDGLDGADGSDGATGADGTNGVDGAQGDQGIQGITGNNGADGADGSDGATGPDGNNGATGANGTDGTTPTPSTDANKTILSLANPQGTYYNMASAHSAATYTLAGSILGGFAQVLVNRATEPDVTGATKTSGSTFLASTDMYLVVSYNGTRAEYFFLKI